MTRKTLPPRRPSISFTIPWAVTINGNQEQRRLDIMVGFDPTTGELREVFAQYEREGSDLQRTLSDACVIISVALQHGVPLDALAKSVFGSPVAAIVQGVQNELREGINP